MDVEDEVAVRLKEAKHAKVRGRTRMRGVKKEGTREVHMARHQGKVAKQRDAHRRA